MIGLDINPILACTINTVCHSCIIVYSQYKLITVTCVSIPWYGYLINTYTDTKGKSVARPRVFKQQPPTVVEVTATKTKRFLGTLEMSKDLEDPTTAASLGEESCQPPLGVCQTGRRGTESGAGPLCHID